MLYGEYPFFGVTIPELISVIKKKVQNFTFPDEPEVSDDSKDLIRALLQPDPKKRISFSDFFKHKIFQTVGSMYKVGDNNDLQNDMMMLGQALKEKFDVDSEFQ